MRWILDEVWDFAEWTDAIQEVIWSKVKVIPVPEGASKDEENIGKENVH